MLIEAPCFHCPKMDVLLAEASSAALIQAINFVSDARSFPYSI